MPVKSYRELVAWQKAMDLVSRVYEITAKFPEREVFGLTSQLRRCAVSVPSNIAEGQGRSSRGEFKLFLGHARGSLFELQTQISIAERLHYIDQKTHEQTLVQAVEVGKIINGLLAALG